MKGPILKNVFELAKNANTMKWGNLRFWKPLFRNTARQYRSSIKFWIKRQLKLIAFLRRVNPYFHPLWISRLMVSKLEVIILVSLAKETKHLGVVLSSG